MPSITNLIWSTKKDIIPRYASGGAGASGTGMATNTLLGPYPTRSDISPYSNCLVWAGSGGANLVLNTATPYSCSCSSGVLCSTTPVVDSTYFWQFCGRDCLNTQPIAISANQVTQQNIQHQPVSIPPGGTFLLYLAAAGQSSVASALELELGYVER